MSRRLQMLTSSIGKKEFMAVSGLGLIGFLIAHLLGNLSIFKGSESFNGYAKLLHSVGPVLRVVEIGLASVFLLHIVLALTVTLQNWKARGEVRYQGKRTEGGRSLGSSTMWFSGLWILAFLGIHLSQFVVPGLIDEEATPIATLVAERLHEPLWAAYYTVTMLLVGLHISHGFWSALQTLGFAPPRRGAPHNASTVLGVIFALGFGSVAIAVFATDLLK